MKSLSLCSEAHIFSAVSINWSSLIPILYTLVVFTQQPWNSLTGFLTRSQRILSWFRFLLRLTSMVLLYSLVISAQYWSDFLSVPSTGPLSYAPKQKPTIRKQQLQVYKQEDFSTVENQTKQGCLPIQCLHLSSSSISSQSYYGWWFHPHQYLLSHSLDHCIHLGNSSSSSCIAQ